MSKTPLSLIEISNVDTLRENRPFGNRTDLWPTSNIVLRPDYETVYHFATIGLKSKCWIEDRHKDRVTIQIKWQYIFKYKLFGFATTDYVFFHLDYVFFIFNFFVRVFLK